MKTLEVGSDQIITLNDYPVFGESALQHYFEQCRKGKDLPFVPVIRKEIVTVYFNDGLQEKFRSFEQKNKLAEYFMLDGTHRTTALSLAGRKIRIIVYERDEDIVEAKGMVATGEICESGTLEESLEENCRVLKSHFEEKPYFMTVKQKTEKMKRENVLPQNIQQFLQS